jgi:hypothetical protein
MDINSLAKVLFDVHTLYLCLAVYVVTYFVRMLFEGIWKVLDAQGAVKKWSTLGRIWTEVVVPILPILIGGCLGLAAKTFVWPDYAVKTKLARVLYGAVCGLFSSFIYNRIRGWLKSKPDGSQADSGPGAAADLPGLTAPTVVEIHVKADEVKPEESKKPEDPKKPAA